MKIDLILIRHQQSCNNKVAQLESRLSQWKRAFYPDPPITHYGMQQLKAIQDRVDFENDVDLVLSSPMLRAIQTAVELFPKKQIWITPFTKENHSGVSNKPSTIGRQKTFFNKQDWNRLHYDYVCNERKEFSEDAFESNFNKFLKWLEKHLQELIKHSHLDTSKRKLTIALTGHSGVMQEVLGLESRPNNVQAILLPLKWKKKEHKLKKISTKNNLKHVIFQGFDVPDKDEFFSMKGDRNCAF